MGNGPLHYIDIPVCRLSSGNCPEPPPTGQVVWAIGDADETLESSSSTMESRAEQIRYLIHFIGDVHQPLHAATYFSSQFPGGDAGGNAWKVAGVPYATELHAVWDEGLGMWTSQLHRPLNSTGFEWVKSLSTKVISEFPLNSFLPQVKNSNVTEWAEESYTIAKTFVYTAPQAPEPIPSSYLLEGQKAALQRLALAGYRLAETLYVLLPYPILP